MIYSICTLLATTTCASPILTADEGEQIGTAFMDTLRSGFAADDFSTQHPMFADHVDWDWSGGVVGSGTRDDYYDTLATTWQPLVSSFQPSNVMVVTDTERGIISLPHELVINIDGRGNAPTCLFAGANVFELHVGRDHKITQFRGLWDSNNVDMNRCIHEASKPDIVRTCAGAYLNFQTKGEHGIPLSEYWTEDAIFDPKFPVEGLTRQVGREAILAQLRDMDEHPGLAGFAVDPYRFDRVGDRVYVAERITTNRGGTFNGLAVHTFNSGGECVDTTTYHANMKLIH
jgi:hypothetical protein